MSPTSKHYTKFNLQVGKNIRHVRRLNKMTQHELAAQVGVRFQQIQKYETAHNRPPLETLLKIAMALNTPFKRLLAGTGYELDSISFISLSPREFKTKS